MRSFYNVQTLFKNPFQLTVLSIVFFELLSLLVHWVPILQTPISILLVFCVAIISLYRLEAGVAIAILELIIGSKGYLFSIDLGFTTISIRIGIFITVIGAYVIRTIIHRIPQTTFKQKKLLALLAGSILLGIGIGLYHGNNVKILFNDVNGWFFFLYILPFMEVVNDNRLTIHRIVQLFLAATTTIVIKTMALLYVFSHQFPVPRDIYKWVRDTGVGEITLLSGNFYRIFSQNHIFIVIGIFIVGSILVFNDHIKHYKRPFWGLYALLVGYIATTVLSLSRSNWVGLIIGLFFFGIVTFFIFKKRFKAIIKITSIGISAIMAATIIIGTIVYIPLSKTHVTDPGQAIKDRFQVNEAAVSSRWAQLPVLTPAILQDPLLGHGWGSTVTYQTADPRILSEQPDGQYTTFAFEWGYLDIIYKIGFVGMIIYFVYLGSIFKQLFTIQKDVSFNDRALIFGLLIGLLSLMVTHAFSPYLNHPIGIGYLIFISMIAHSYRNQLDKKRESS